ncbi:GOLPH3/VPS74 family protein [Desulfonatronovibrio magnus]|uniref:GOLPH3/VPS74 family protein n=1 Tax=Desulfonatronovibrio magnus TaxID=698827 RepID=UPI0005EB3735|nr:GPP34 family phosphoprotein [Desulfonatronovibrio magnus]
MLTFAQEILLLALDDKKGTIKPLPFHSLRFALAGSLLMELAFCDRIDTDLDYLTVVNSEPTGSPLLDKVLARLQESDKPQSTEYWLDELAWNMENIKEKTLEELVQNNILKLENRKILWVFETRRYPLIDDEEVKEVRSRLREIIANKEVPSPRDAVLISLVHACNLFQEIFTPEELEKHLIWINKIAKLDLIGREVNQAISKIYETITSHSIMY